MNSGSSQFFIIAGPTAVGKSELAVAMAERCGGEIISADAFQVYQGLDILTAKPSTDLRARIPHHLIGEIPLTHSFDVAQFLRLAQERIAEIRSRGRSPIIVGGTGLYLRALTHGLAELPTADAALRSQLESQTLEKLCIQLSELDPVGHDQIDRQNRRRVIRALEICLLTGRRFSSFREQWNASTNAASGVVLSRDRATLQERIDRRTEAMFAEGVIEEVRHTGPIGPTACQTLGWREIHAVIDGTMHHADCVAAIQQSTRRYAKRQLTWFRREPHLELIHLTDETAGSQIAENLAQRARQAIE